MRHINTLRQRITRGLVLLAVLVGLVGCTGHYPADPEGTLDRVSGGTLRVGVSHEPPWTDTLGEGNSEEDPGGIEPQLIQDYARSIGAEVEWHAGGEEQLTTMLEESQLDLVIGGITDESPWSSKGGLTTTYAESLGVDGSTSKHVMVVPMGENAFMTSLESFLLDQDIDKQLPEEMRP
ncbi:transporter substrate-binding domain-containing protein [Enteractinococcus fodinae]|uniref:ABC-type amino acid transport substrate-binding protein n=2 Tax=Enteractinococcus fodinae TaxID=684663 RepID=A0ABU2AXE5_9MICC|nr:ABC-type amino acid transport substrate-binding protein [Enteractinococcus fodinae]